MYRSTPTLAHVGARLGASIYSEGGWPLLKAGRVIGPRHIQVIQDLGYSRVVMLAPDEAARREFVNPDIRGGIEQALAGCANFLLECWRRPGQSPAGTGADIEKELSARLPEFVTDVQENTSLTLPGATRSGPASWLDDAVNGAAIAVFLAQHLNMDADHRTQIAQGMLLRDIAQLTLLPGVMDHPNALSPVQGIQVQQHAQRLYHLLSTLRWGSEASRLIVLQHHERGDGSGYPQGLRAVAGAAAPTIHVLGELAAIADVFNALSMDRPHRPALTAVETRQTLDAMAGVQLHHAMVHELLSVWEPPEDRALPEDARPLRPVAPIRRPDSLADRLTA